MRKYVEERVKEVAEYAIQTKEPVRAIAKHFGISKTTVYTDITLRIFEINKDVFAKTREVLDFNKEQRHIRGGISTAKKYTEK